MKKFIGSGADKPVPTVKTQLPQQEADAVSGATITFTAVAQALEAGSSFAKNLGGSK